MKLEAKYRALLSHAEQQKGVNVQGMSLCFQLLSLSARIDRDCAALLAPQGEACQTCRCKDTALGLHGPTSLNNSHHISFAREHDTNLFNSRGPPNGNDLFSL